MWVLRFREVTAQLSSHLTAGKALRVLEWHDESNHLGHLFFKKQHIILKIEYHTQKHYWPASMAAKRQTERMHIQGLCEHGDTCPSLCPCILVRTPCVLMISPKYTAEINKDQPVRKEKVVHSELLIAWESATDACILVEIRRQGEEEKTF